MQAPAGSERLALWSRGGRRLAGLRSCLTGLGPAARARDRRWPPPPC